MNLNLKCFKDILQPLVVSQFYCQTSYGRAFEKRSGGSAGDWELRGDSNPTPRPCSALSRVTPRAVPFYRGREFYCWDQRELFFSNSAFKTSLRDTARESPVNLYRFIPIQTVFYSGTASRDRPKQIDFRRIDEIERYFITRESREESSRQNHDENFLRFAAFEHLFRGW